MLNSLTSKSGQRTYDRAITDFVEWYCSEPRLAFNRTVVLRYRIYLEQKQYAATTINLRLAAVRRVAFEASDSGLLIPELAAGNRRVKGVRRIGVRVGNWLTAEQGKQLLGAVDRESIRGKRNHAMMAMLIGCGLHRGELLALRVDSIQMREEHWVIADLLGKAGHIRTVPIPRWVKAAIDEWKDASRITEGALFRSIDKNGRVWGNGMTPKVLWEIVREAASRAGIEKLAPHDLRRTCARLCHLAGGELDQIQFLLGHVSIRATVQFSMLHHAGQGDEDAYRHPFIPRIGRAVSAPLERALEYGPTLFNGFLQSYLRAGAAELKDELASPRFILSSVALVQIGDLDEAAKAYRFHFPTITWGDFADRERYPQINLAIMITYDKLDAIAGNWSDILPLSRRHDGFAFSAPRNSNGCVYVLAGRDDKIVAEVVKRLAAIRTASGDGLVLSVD